MKHQGLDHLAIAVPDTEEALKLWRDTMGFPFLYSEVVNGGTVRLTHLDMGNVHLQLVEPLTPDHPLQAWLAKNGPGLHHFCLKVDDVGEMASSPFQGTAASSPPESPNAAGTPLSPRVAGTPPLPAPHQGTQGKRALFLDKASTQNVQVEVTGK